MSIIEIEDDEVINNSWDDDGGFEIDGDDVMYGGFSMDDLRGGAGHDVLDSGEGDDILDGGNDNDDLTGGAGDDHLSGGRGNDVFHYELRGNGTDTIQDFTYGDSIRIAGADFTNSAMVMSSFALRKNQIYVETSDTMTALHIGTDDIAGEDVVVHLSRSATGDLFDCTGDTISLNTQYAAKHLESHGVGMEEARGYIWAHVDSAETIYNASKEYGVTTEMLAQIVGNNITQDDVIGYFGANGLNSSVLDL